MLYILKCINHCKQCPPPLSHKWHKLCFILKELGEPNFLLPTSVCCFLTCSNLTHVMLSENVDLTDWCRFTQSNCLPLQSSAMKQTLVLGGSTCCVLKLKATFHRPGVTLMSVTSRSLVEKCCALSINGVDETFQTHAKCEVKGA